MNYFAAITQVLVHCTGVVTRDKNENRAFSKILLTLLYRHGLQFSKLGSVIFSTHNSVIVYNN